MTQELQDYIKKSKEAGFSDEQIKQELLKVGWKEQDINQALTGNAVPAPMPKPEIAGPKSKSKLLRVIVIVVIAIVLIGGGVLGYNYLIKPSAIKDCGTVTNLESVISNLDSKNPFANVSDQVVESLKCMDNSLINCQQAKIKIITENKEMIYEIKGKEGQNCLISGPLGKSRKYQTCRISPGDIVETKTALEQHLNPDGLVFWLTIMAININTAFVPSDFVGSNYPLGPVEIVKNDANGESTTKFYNYDCR